MPSWVALSDHVCIWCTDPATWMLDISTVTAEERRKEDLGELFAQSHLRECVLTSVLLSNVHTTQMLPCQD